MERATVTLMSRQPKFTMVRGRLLETQSGGVFAPTPDGDFWVDGYAMAGDRVTVEYDPTDQFCYVVCG